MPGRLTRGFALATENPDERRIGSAVGDGPQDELLKSLLRQLTSLTEEIRNANRIQLHRIMAEQTGRALADPALAEAMSTLQGLSEARRRQVLFVNAQYSAIMLNHQLGAIDWNELIGHLRVWCVNGVFQQYWEMTGDHRKSLPRDSLEARVGRAVDFMLDELAEGAEEWWVVGTPDTDPSG
ncbi:DUF6082 family protein [Streptomyces sp. NBC_00019]|uniref:DUF6082 family protein n=1 Tax=Streptomyces sp. NBC_00019 TaxID=2975623 RepID=UPI00324A8311